MESDPLSASGQAPPTTARAQEVLGVLDRDRDALADRLAAPWWTSVLVAASTAGFVATPAIGADGVRDAVVGVGLAVAVTVLVVRPWWSGARFGRGGAAAALLHVAVLITVLLLLSVSYGVVSLASAWWVLLPAAVCFAAVLAGVRRLERLRRESLRRGR